jgi:hypothetical protein
MDTSIPSFLPDGVVLGVIAAAVPAIAILALLLARLARPRLPRGAVSLASGATRRALTSQATGAYQLIAIGTFGVNACLRVLRLLDRGGMAGMVGSILLTA